MEDVVDPSETLGAPPMASTLVGRVRRASRGTVVSILVVAYVAGVGLAWAFLTPIGGVPDEHTHISYSAGVVRGDLGTPGPTNHPRYEQQNIVTVPEWIGGIGQPCYAFHPEVTADCAPPLGSSEVLVPLATSVNRYTPLYYSFVGLPTLVMSGASAVYAMRAISVLLATGLIGAGLSVASPSRRLWLALAVMVSFSPQAGHFVGSVNPTGLEVGAALGLGIALVGTVGSEHNTRFILVTAGLAFALAWSRPLSFMTLGGVVAVGIMVNGANLRRRLPARVSRSGLIALVLTATLGAIAYDVLVRSPAEQVVREAIIGDATPPFGLAQNLRELPGRFLNWGGEMVGNFGWGDHRPPYSIRLGWLFLGLVLVIIAFAAATRRQRLAFAATIVGATVLAPLFVIQFVLRADGYQARYHLPLVTLVAVVAAVVISGSVSDRHRRAGWAVLRWGSLITATAMLVSMAGSMHRNGIGGEVPSMRDILTFRFLSNLDWIPAPALGGLMIGTFILVVSAVSTFVATRGASSDSDRDDASLGVRRVGSPR